VAQIADNKGKTCSQVALRWLLQQEVVPSVVIGARNMEQLESSIGAASGWKLTDEEMLALDAVSQPCEPDMYVIGSKFKKQRYAIAGHQ